MRYFGTSRGARRASTATALVAGLALVTSMPSMAQAVPELSAPTTRTVAPLDDLVPMVEVEADDFEAEARELPDELEVALKRDVQMTGAEWLAQAEAAAVAVDVVDALREHIEVVDSRLDGTELVVTVESSADAEVVESVGARAELGTASEGRETEVIEGLEPAADLRGGLPYSYTETIPNPQYDPVENPNVSQTINVSFRCSTGFVGIDSVTEDVEMLTAGHCQGNAGTNRTSMTITRAGGTSGSPTGLGSSTVLGPALDHVISEYPDESDSFYDHGFIDINEAAWTPKPEVVTYGFSSSGAPLASTPVFVRDAGPTTEGATICKSGATSGWTCGTVEEIDEVYPVGGSSCALSDYCVGGILATICVRGGDSGGAALVGTRAVGITSASSAPDSGCRTGEIGIFSHVDSEIYEAATDLHPNWEPLLAFAQTNRNSTSTVRLDPASTPNLLGRITGGSSRHSVSVSINGGAASTPTVSSSGDWAVPLAGQRGTLNWSATASWGSQSQSTPSTGRIFVADDVRLSGASRYETAIAISKYAFPGSPNVPVVYIANGANFPDALSAGPAAAAEGGPLLLTEGGSLPSAVRTELNRLNPDTIVIVGGSSVVSGSVANALGNYADTVVRLGGSNRYETSRLIAQRGITRGFFATGQQVWIATGANYADALSAGAAAASAGVPILLVNGTASSADSATRVFLRDTLGVTIARIAGGTAVVSSGVASSIDSLSGVSVARYGGANRYSTSLLINQFAHPDEAPEAFLTYGQNFPDALAGGVIAGLNGGPMYITQTSCVEPGVVNHILDISPEQITVFGGTSVVSNAARDLRRC